ncbi:unnamed protein product [Microthlaspi erraticum]|uniref:Uncharacterized protein n=1 Tax=Microthlaspi erraticum TaxID=1685480 RepID=A0A6D2LES8_9BRAS|nr:unnamed protein product [Microthlaspi erraticum]
MFQEASVWHRDRVIICSVWTTELVITLFPTVWSTSCVTLHVSASALASCKVSSDGMSLPLKTLSFLAFCRVHRSGKRSEWSETQICSILAWQLDIRRVNDLLFLGHLRIEGIAALFHNAYPRDNFSPQCLSTRQFLTGKQPATDCHMKCLIFRELFVVQTPHFKEFMLRSRRCCGPSCSLSCEAKAYPDFTEYIPDLVCAQTNRSICIVPLSFMHRIHLISSFVKSVSKTSPLHVFERWSIKWYTNRYGSLNPSLPTNCLGGVTGIHASLHTAVFAPDPMDFLSPALSRSLAAVILVHT